MRKLEIALLLVLAACDQDEKPCLEVATCFEDSPTSEYRECVGDGSSLPVGSPVAGLASIASDVCESGTQDECLNAVWQVRSEILSCVVDESYR